MKQLRYDKIIHIALVIISILFGVVTIFVGSRVLAGANPGYIVFRPLLIYNTIMGIAYVATGILAWRNIVWSRCAAGAIFVINLVVLAAIVYLYATGGAVAIDSVRAMIFRTVIWLMLFVGLVWLSYRNS